MRSSTGNISPPGNTSPSAPVHVAGQQEMFVPSESPASSDRVGYRGPVACAAAGITYRQLDYWARTGLVEPSIRTAHGSGTQRLYSFPDIVVLKIVKRLLNTGISLQNIRAAVGYLRERGSEDLARLTIISDGASVYECACPDDIIDLVQGGQGVFGIAVDRVWQEVECSLSQFPGENPDVDEALPEYFGDELARRRRGRAV